MLRSLIVEADEVPSLVRLLEDFFIKERLDRKLGEVDRALRSSSPIVKRHWIIPETRIWLSIIELRKAAANKFRGHPIRALSTVSCRG
jgi:hypothetical protein